MFQIIKWKIVYSERVMPKIWTGLNIIIGCCSKSIGVIKLSLSQNDPLIRETFWQNNSLVTHILFELKPIMIFSPVVDFGHHPLCTSKNPKKKHHSVALVKKFGFRRGGQLNRTITLWTTSMHHFFPMLQFLRDYSADKV